MTLTYHAEILPDEHWWMQGRAHVLESLVSNRVPTGGVVLDAGAGNGFWAERLKSHFDNVVLIEPDSKLRAAIADRTIPAQVLSASLPGPLPLPDEGFRLITCLDVLEHVPDDRATVGELYRLNEPNGRLLTAVPAHPKLWSSHDEAVGHQRRYTKAALREVTEGAGYSIELLAPLNVWLYPVAWAFRKVDRVGDATPPAPINRVLTWLFSSEARLVARWPAFVKGLSWICLARKT